MSYGIKKNSCSKVNNNNNNNNNNNVIKMKALKFVIHKHIKNV